MPIQTYGSHDWTALMWAARNSHAAAVKLLLEKGADPNLKDRAERTALHWPEYYGNAQIADLLRAAMLQKAPDTGKPWTERTQNDDHERGRSGID